MKKRILIISFLLIQSLLFNLHADEGMWIPLLIEKLNIQDMQEKGFQLTAEDIYSVNQASMKDAVMIFGGGCTAELISGEGLLITNHHCGYRRIQQHSTVEHDYLRHGFWAMSKEEELPNPGLTATFLKRMEDVTGKVLNKVTNNLSEQERDEQIRINSAIIVEEAIAGTHYRAHVEPFFAGNQYFLFVEEVFLDVRFVGAPPSAIGKFGGDTDNWMWPRHTGDFSLFRIYANSENEPAPYDEMNVPYKPLKFFPISLKGVQPDDFTMIFGYPGSTYEYVPSFHLDMLTNKIYPKLIDIRSAKLDIMNSEMEKDPKVRIQYAAKNASVSNSWKRWIGEIRGLNILNASFKKQEYEKGFQAWANKNNKSEYSNLLKDFEKTYTDFSDYRLARDYYREVFISNGAELVSFAGRFESLVNALEEDEDDEEILKMISRLRSQAENFYKDYDLGTDQQLFMTMLSMFNENMTADFKPSFYINIRSKYQNNFETYTKQIYSKTFFDEPETLYDLLDNPGKGLEKKIKSDPVYQIYTSANTLYDEKIVSEYTRLGADLNQLQREYMAAQMEYQSDKVFYPDANRTLRLSFGNIKGYEPKDAVYFKHYTTLKGIIEKDNPEIYDYDVPDKLKELYTARDFGRFAENGELHVCFIATNHTTGGNSGSPVLNAEGHLIGVNFDRAWEGVMSDLMFNPEQCRNISLDIRFALFIIDKFAGAGYLLDEMEIIE